MLAASQPMFVAWGRGRTLLYNDAYASLMGRKPAGIGQDLLDVWFEIRDDLTPIVEAVYAGRPVHMDDIELLVERSGYPEEAHFAFSYTPVRNEDGEVAGFFCACMETSAQVFAERRRAALLSLDERLRDVTDPAKIAYTSTELLGEKLGACRVGYGEFNTEAGTISVNASWSAPALPTVSGVYSFADYGSYVADLARGEVVAVADVSADQRTARQTAAFTALGIRAHLDVPIVENGRTVAEVFVHSPTPRHWGESDIALARDFAERSRGVIARRAAEAKLQEHETRLRAVQDASIDGFMLLDSVRGANGRIVDFRWVHVNAAAAAIVGRPVDWFPGKLMLEHMPGNIETGLFDAYVRVVETGEPWTSEFGYDRDGVNVYLRLVAAKAGDGFAVNFADLSERKRSEERLRESEARYRTLFDTIDEAFSVIEFIDGPSGPMSDFVHVQVNPAFRRQTGLGDVVGSTGSQIMGADETREWVKLLRHSLESGEAVRFERELMVAGRTMEGACFRVEPPEKRQVAVLFRDISERKRTEDALRESEARFRNVADHAPVMMWVTDADGFCTYLNKGWYEFTGQTPEESEGFGWLGATHPDDKAEAERVFLRSNARHEAFRIEYRLRRRDGRYRWAIDGASPRFDASGSFLGFVGSVVDIDDRGEMEERLRELNETLEARVAERTRELEQAHEQLRQSQKLESMGQLTGGVAHDFNNLLTPIVGALDLLQRKGVGGAREQRLIAGAAQSADRAKTLVQRLLAFARRQPLQSASVDLVPLVRGMAELVRSTTGPHIEVVVDAPDGLPPAHVDSNQLEMAILNLAVNARDAMPDGGTLTIAVRGEDVVTGQDIDLEPGHYLRLSVIDTGEGMDEATVRRAIEPFFSTKGIGKGTGLGLSMVHGLASQLGGALTIQSAPGQGTRIELWLKQGTDSATSINQPAISPHEPKESGTVLLVDDEESVRLMAADMLTDLGFAVIEAACADQALNLVDDGLAPDVLVTDHLMPGMTGTRLAELMASRFPETKILIMSGYAEAEGIAVQFARLNKPFRREELAHSLAALK